MSSTCPICLLDVRVPVELICFPCSKPKKTNHQIHCHSVTRVCMTCARTYLELNKNAYERSTTKKCLFCHTTVNPCVLNAEKAYRKDYRMMAMDPRSDYKCIQCDVIVGNQNDIDRHLRNECPNRTKFCRLCGVLYKACFEFDHIASCPGMTGCSLCEWYGDKSKLEAHLRVCHDKYYCHNCKDMVKTSIWNEHVQNQCPMRWMHCQFCSVTAQLPFYKMHMHSHIKEWTEKISTCVQELSKLEKTTMDST